MNNTFLRRCIFLWYSCAFLLFHIESSHARKVERQPRASYIQPRIVGGTDAEPGEFPYFIQIGLCAGSLIAPGVVLSSAHCQEILEIGTYVTVQPHAIKDLQAKRVRIVERHHHPWYWDEWASYDMILLRLEEAVYYNDSKVSLQINQNHQFPPDNTTLTAIGLGDLIEGGSRLPDVLQKVNMESINLEWCNKTLEGDLLDDSFLCAGALEGGKDTCQGDSGGPLLYIDGNKHVLTGLVSWGVGCGIAGIPGAYARVSKGLTWIKRLVCECWKVEGAAFCREDDVVVEMRSHTIEELTFECPIVVDPNCQNTPGFVDHTDDGCEWYEYNENAGCFDYGDSPGGPGFEQSNANENCCWCGGGRIVDPIKFERHPECQDYPRWRDIHRDDCRWYEENTEEGTCSGWGGTRGGSGMRDWTPEIACCHCGGGTFPTAAPSHLPSQTPSESKSPSNVPSHSLSPSESAFPSISPTIEPTQIQSGAPSLTPLDDTSSPTKDDSAGPTVHGSIGYTVAILLLINTFIKL